MKNPAHFDAPIPVGIRATTRGNQFTVPPAQINDVPVIRNYAANRSGIDYIPTTGAGTVKFARLLDGWVPTDSLKKR